MSKIILALYVLAASFGLIFLKLGTHNGIPVRYLDGKIQANINGQVVLGILFYGLSFLLYIYLISKNDLGFIIPLTTGLVYILIFTASYFIFREAFTTAKVLAILMILSGVVLLNLKK